MHHTWLYKQVGSWLTYTLRMFTGASLLEPFCSATASANERYHRSTELLCGYAVMHLLNPRFHKLGSLRNETCYSCYSCHGRCVSRRFKHSKESESMKPLTSKPFQPCGTEGPWLASDCRLKAAGNNTNSYRSTNHSFPAPLVLLYLCSRVEDGLCSTHLYYSPFLDANCMFILFLPELTKLW